MKILVTGARGQLGADGMQVWGEQHDVQGVDLPEVDLTNPNDLTPILSSFSPDVVVHCAAYTQVDRAEDERAAAEAVNTQATRWLARETERRKARLIYISTDYVFDGKKPYPEAYEETDSVNPLSWYGRTKLDGEDAVRESGSRHVILRTSWLYGIHGHNFLKTILHRARSGQPLRIVNDQYGCPTWSRRLAHQIEAFLHDGQGLYHAAGDGACTWYDLACCFLDALGVSHAAQPCLTRDYPTRAHRPRNSTLRNARLIREERNQMRPWDADVRAYAERYRDRLWRETGGNESAPDSPPRKGTV